MSREISVWRGTYVSSKHTRADRKPSRKTGRRVKVKNGIRRGRFYSTARNTRWIKLAQSRNRIPSRLWFRKALTFSSFKRALRMKRGYFLLENVFMMAWIIPVFRARSITARVKWTTLS